MDQQESRGVQTQCFLHHLARVDGRAVDSSAKELDVLNQSVPRVQCQKSEHLVIESAEFEFQELRGPLRTGEHRGAGAIALSDNGLGLVEHLPAVGLAVDLAVSNVE